MNRDRAAEIVASLFESWYGTLVRYGQRNTGGKEAVFDAVQRTFMDLYQALMKGQEIRHPKAWTLCVLRRELSVAHEEGLGCEPLEALDSHCAGRYEPSFADLESDEVSKVLRALTPREQEVVLLRMEAMKYREIADAMGISTNSVNVLLARAVLKLRPMLRKSENGMAQVKADRSNAHAPKTLQ